MNHEWGPSRLNHGSAQCRRCLCTWEEAHFGGISCIRVKAPRTLPAEQAKLSASGEAGEVEQCDRDAARLLIEWCRLTEVSEDMLIDHFRVFRSSVIAAALAALRANAPEADEATVERVKLPRLSEKMIRAACKAHYGEDNIDGIDLTANGCNYTFRDGFKRMWKGVATALRANAIEAQAGEDKP